MDKKNIKNSSLVLKKVDQELYIDDEEINIELRDQPLLFRKYASLEVETNKHFNILANELKRVEAEVYTKIKENSGKLTIKDLEMKITLHPKVSELKRKLIEAEATVNTMKVIVQAFRQRHEAIKEISANIRKEIVN